MADRKGKKFMVTQNNPQKWIRPSDSSKTEEENEFGQYEKHEFESFYNNLPDSFRSNVRYAKFALERGESGTFHLQGFLLFTKDERRSYTYKLMPHADIKEAYGTIQEASSYIGNLDFKHADGTSKGGEVFWVWEYGKLPSNRECRQKGEPTETEKRLLGLKEIVDAKNGKAVIKQLWNDDFYMMLRYGRAIKDYINDCYEEKQVESISNGTVTLAKIQRLEEENNSHKDNIRIIKEHSEKAITALKDANYMLEIENRELRRGYKSNEEGI